MPRGGARPGAGRKKGSLGKRTIGRQLINQKAIELDITPLEVMLTTMKTHWAQGETAEACAIARDAAPYVHRRLASISADVKTHDSLDHWSAQVLEETLAHVEAQIKKRGLNSNSTNE